MGFQKLAFLVPHGAVIDKLLEEGRLEDAYKVLRLSEKTLLE
jgi:hypothetical protein